jgi:hypothetical protein
MNGDGEIKLVSVSREVVNHHTTSDGDATNLANTFAGAISSIIMHAQSSPTAIDLFTEQDRYQPKHRPPVRLAAAIPGRRSTHAQRRVQRRVPCGSPGIAAARRTGGLCLGRRIHLRRAKPSVGEAGVPYLGVEVLMHNAECSDRFLVVPTENLVAVLLGKKVTCRCTRRCA